VRDPDPSPAVAFHPAGPRRALRFGPFRFDTLDRTLSRDGEEIRLPPRALAILEYLIERPSRVVPKQELIDAVWKDAFVGETSLTEAIGVLRQALGDTAAEPRYIQTIHRRGYRFTGELRAEAPGSSALAPVAPAGHEQPAAQATRRTSLLTPGRLALAAIALAMGAVAAWMLRPSPPPAQVTRATITLPVTQAPAPGLIAQPVAALSPDGRRIVYTAGAPGHYRLYLRSIDQFEAIALPGTDGAHAAFFSPNGQSIGFFARGRLFAMRLPDAEAVDLADAGSGHGGWWHTDDSIVFATGTALGLRRVPARGGVAAEIAVTGLDPARLRHPSLLPDGRTLLATHWKQNVRNSDVVAIDVETGTARAISRGVHPRALPDGRVAYLRDGDLVASPLAHAGSELPLIQGVMTGVTGAGQYSLASNGTLLYLPDSPSRLLRQIQRVPGDGAAEPLPFENRAFQNIAVSPDGRLVATTIYERGASDLWIGEIARGTLSRLTTQGGVVDPVWSRDGRTVFFGLPVSGQPQIHRAAADGTGQPAVFSTTAGLSPASTTTAGLVFANRLRATGIDIVTVTADGSVRDWLATPFQEAHPRVSPDDRWVAYASNRTGRAEIYVRAASGAGGDRHVSAAGGGQPEWAPDGRAVYFTRERRVYRVDMSTTPLGQPVPRHADSRLVLARPAGDGLIVLNAIEEERPITTLNLVMNWTEEIRRAIR
jgi:DNA-binding winged helix-turn-helix (wHTH) protein/Tol biopolymer transport system component